MLNYIDLFAGAGGLSEGFIATGFHPVAHVEMNSDACQTLRTRAGYYYLKSVNKISIYKQYLKGEINRDTFYAQKDYYSDTYKKVNEILEDETINSVIISYTFRIFYMKNKFDYKDKQDINANVTTQEIKVELED